MLEEDLSLRDVAQQELHGDAQLGHVLLKAWSRVLGSLPPGLQEMTVSLGVGQLDGLDTTQVVVVPGSDGRSDLVKYEAHLLLPGPLAVARLLGEGGLQDQLVRLVVQVVVEIVPQQAVDKDGLRIEQSGLVCDQSQTRSPVPRSHSSAWRF